jgi:hypothetical protein
MAGLPYDLLIDPAPAVSDGTNHLNLGLMFARAPAEGGAFRIDADPGKETTENPVYSDFSLGMFSSERYTPGMGGWGVNVCTRVPGVTLPGGRITEVDIPVADRTVLAYRCSEEYGGDLYFFGGRKPIKIPSGTGAPVEAFDFGSDNICSINNATAQFNDILWIGSVVVSTNATYSLWAWDGTTLTEYNTILRRMLATVKWDTDGSPAYRLVGMPTSSTFRTVSANPAVAGDWSAAVTIGGAERGINSIAIAPRVVYFVGADGIFFTDARADSSNYSSYWRQALVASNGTASHVFDGDVRANFGAGLDRIGLDGRRQSISRYYQPGADTADGSPVWGYCTALANDLGWEVAAFYNPTENKSYVCYNKDRKYFGLDGEGVVWHGAEAVFDGIVTHMRVTSPTSGHRRLWVCVETPNGYSRLFWVSLPFSGNPYQDLIHGGSHRFNTAGSLYVPDGWFAPTSRRVVYRHDVYADRLDGVAQVGIYASRDKGDYELQGNASSSPRTSFIPESVEESAYRIDFRIDLQGTNENPPVFRAFQPRADVNREQIPIWGLKLRLAAAQATNNSGYDTQYPDITLDRLWSQLSETATPVRILNRRGDAMVGQILPNIHVEAKENPDEGLEFLVDISIRELWVEWYWDSGVPYDSGRFWG